MDVSKALDDARTAILGSSQGRIAKEIGVDGSALSRWLREKSEPTGAQRELLIEWATRRQDARHTSPPDARADAEQRTAQTVVRLASIYGFAEAVLRMLQAAAKEQQNVLDTLAPWALRDAVGLRDEADFKALITQHAESRAQTPLTAEQSRRQETDPAATHTARDERSSTTAPADRTR